MKRQDFPLVQIEWVDSIQPRSRWEYLENLRASEAILCVSVGWLVSDDDKTKMVAPNIAVLNDPNSLQASGVITIPTESIRKLTRLKEPVLTPESKKRFDSL